MLINVYFSPNFNGPADFKSFDINSSDELLKLLPQTWLDLFELHEVEENSSEAFIIALLPGESQQEINCASFAFNDGALHLQFNEFIEPNDPQIKIWEEVGLDTNKLYEGEAGLKDIIDNLLRL